MRLSLPRLSDFILPFAVLALIATVLATTDWHNRSNAITNMEDREAAVLPAAPHSLSTLYHYPVEFSRFMDDHYGLRESAISVRAHIWFWLLHDVFAPDVMIGRHRWLFFTGNRELQDTLHTDPLPAATLNDWAERIEARRQWLAARGIKYLFVLAPDKRSIYPEMLPPMDPRPGLTRREQLDARLAGQPSWLDLTDALRADKGQGQLYYRWDTHWKRHGAYDAYRAVAQRLGLVPEPEDLGRAFSPELHHGDLGRLSGLTLTEHDRIPIASCERPDPHPPNPDLFDNHFAEMGRVYQVPPSTCATGTGRLLMFHDSFGGMWEPWLSTQFAQVVYVWRQPSFAELKRMVEIDHPTVVIEQRLERFLIWPLRP